MPTQFITLFIGRTGSTYLMDMLSRHPWVTALGEEIGKRKQLPADEQNAWLDAFYRSRGCHTLAHGFKTKLWDVRDHDHLRSVINERSIRIIRLTRRNTLRAAISTIRSHELHASTGRWNARSLAERPPPSQIDFAWLDDLIKGREQAHTRLNAFTASLDTATIDLAYEDLHADRRAVLRTLSRFLRTPLLACIAGRTAITKNTPADWHEAVANLNELKAHLAGTRYEQMLTEP